MKKKYHTRCGVLLRLLFGFLFFPFFPPPFLSSRDVVHRLHRGRRPHNCGVSDVTKFRIKGSKLCLWHQTRCIPGRWVLSKVPAPHLPFFVCLSSYCTGFRILYSVLELQPHIRRKSPNNYIEYVSKKRVYAKQSIIHIGWSQIIGLRRGESLRIPMIDLVATLVQHMAERQQHDSNCRLPSTKKSHTYRAHSHGAVPKCPALPRN